MATLRSSTSGHTKTPRTNRQFYHIELTHGCFAGLYKIPATLAQKIKRQLKGYEVIDAPLSNKEAFKGIHGNIPAWSVNLKGLRTREGLSQVKMAEKLGITQSNLSAYENGKRQIGKNLAKKIASLFKVNYQLFL